MDALDFITAVRRHRRLPWTRVRSSDPGPLAHAVAVVLRLFVGAVVAGAVGHDRPAVTAWLALGVGAAAPVALEKLTVLIPLALRGTAQHVLSSVLAADDGASAPPLCGTDAEIGVEVVQDGPGPEGS
ncbi:hypothetical protein [Streptomyces anandii]